MELVLMEQMSVGQGNHGIIAHVAEGMDMLGLLVMGVLIVTIILVMAYLIP